MPSITAISLRGDGPAEAFPAFRPADRSVTATLLEGRRTWNRAAGAATLHPTVSKTALAPRNRRRWTSPDPTTWDAPTFSTPCTSFVTDDCALLRLWPCDVRRAHVGPSSHSASCLPACRWDPITQMSWRELTSSSPDRASFLLPHRRRLLGALQTCRGGHREHRRHRIVHLGRVPDRRQLTQRCPVTESRRHLSGGLQRQPGFAYSTHASQGD